MLIAGISLQLLAGIIFGLPYILPKSRFQDANKRLKTFLLFPSRGMRRLGVIFLGAVAITVVAVVAWVATVLVPDIPRILLVPLVAVGILNGLFNIGVVYVFLLLRFARIVSRTKEPQNLPDEARFRALLLGNLVQIPVLGGLGCLALWGVSLHFAPNYPGILGAVSWLSLMLLACFAAAAVSCAAVSVVFVGLAGVIRLLSAMAKPRWTLWIIVLSIYVIGGALLITAASKS